MEKEIKSKEALRAFSKSDKDNVFDEDRFINECLHVFAEIRKKYDLEEDLELAQQHHQLKYLVAEVIEGCTQQGILAMASRESGWKSRNVPYRWRHKSFLLEVLEAEDAVSSKTDDWIKHMKPMYEKNAKNCVER